MLLLFGERTRAQTHPIGKARCGVCETEQDFVRVSETVWFTIFGLPVARLENVADYDLCTACHHAFAEDDYRVPSHVPLVREVLAYMLVGYGMHEHSELLSELSRKITGFAIDEAETRRLIREYEGGNIDIQEKVRTARPRLNARGKQEVVTAAFLMAYASCELEYEDRLRINLMGTALGLQLTEVEAVIAELRANAYLGIRRFLPTTRA